MKSRRKLILAIAAMTVLVLLCLYEILAVPHNKEILLARCRNKMGQVDSVSEEMTVETSIVFDQSDLESLSGIGEERIEIPVTMTVRADCGTGGTHVTRKTEYTVFDDVTTTESEGYYAAESGTLYVHTADGWDKREDASAPTYDVNTLLALSESLADRASFHKEEGCFALTYPAADFGNAVVLPFIRDDRVVVTSGEVTVLFDRHSMALCGIRTEGLTFCSVGAVGTPHEGEATSKVTIRADFTQHNALTPETGAVPDEVLASAEKDDPARRRGVVRYEISTADLAKRGKASYTAGTDIPAGNYMIRRKSGSGILKVLEGGDGAEQLVFQSGYDYYKIDSKESGKEVTLSDGDKIILSGDEYVLILETT